MYYRVIKVNDDNTVSNRNLFNILQWRVAYIFFTMIVKHDKSHQLYIKKNLADL